MTSFVFYENDVNNRFSCNMSYLFFLNVKKKRKKNCFTKLTGFVL